MPMYTTADMTPLTSLSGQEVFHQKRGRREFEKGVPKHMPMMKATEVKCNRVLS